MMTVNKLDRPWNIFKNILYPLGPVFEVTSSVAPSALGFEPTPGFADWAFANAAAKATTVAVFKIVMVEIITCRDAGSWSLMKMRS